MQTQALVVSYGTMEWAKNWISETGVSFPFLLDADRKVYRLYELERSFSRIWSPNVLVSYARLLLKGYSLKPVMGDPYQLGADFVVDKEGIVRLAYYSNNPADRPPVGTLLSVAGKTQDKKQSEKNKKGRR